jgi:hypothetical protein
VERCTVSQKKHLGLVDTVGAKHVVIFCPFSRQGGTRQAGGGSDGALVSTIVGDAKIE